jgi:hypothetical protein
MNPQNTPTMPSGDQPQPPTWKQDDTNVQAGITMPASVVVSQRPRKRRLLVALALVGAVIVLGGASAAAYFGYVLPNQPQNILNAALVNEFTPGKVKTESFHGMVTLKDKDNESVAGSFKGSVDKSGPFEVIGSATIATTKATVDLRSTDAKSFYIRLTGLDALAASSEGDNTAMAAYAPLLGTINDQWIEISESLLKEAGAGVDTSNGFKMSDADMKKVADAYKEHQFLAVKEKLADQTVAGKPSHHLRVVIDKQQLKGFISSVKAANIKALDVTSDQLKEFNTSVDKMDFAKYPIDVWVGKTNRLIDQLSFTAKDDSGTASITYTVDDWNKAVKVEKPADAKPVEELLMELYGGSATDAEAFLETQAGSGISL